MSNAVLFIHFLLFSSHPSLPHAGTKDSRRDLVIGALFVFQRDAYTLATQSKFWFFGNLRYSRLCSYIIDL
jgi:hypothetical protein